MSIIFLHDAQGAFIAGDTATRLTAYAYPTSHYASKARAFPASIAKAMMRAEAHRANRDSLPYEREYDARNWARLEKGN